MIKRKKVKKSINKEFDNIGELNILLSRLFCIFLFLTLLLVTVLAVQTKLHNKNELISGNENPTRSEFVFTDPFTSPDDQIIQFFTPQMNGLDSIKIRFAVNQFKGDTSDWRISIGIYDSEEKCIQNSEVPVDDLENWGF